MKKIADFLRNKARFWPFLFIPFIILICYTIWDSDDPPVPWLNVKSETAVFDVRDIDVGQNIITFNRCVEYVPYEMLTPEEFENSDNIIVGKVPVGTEYCTMRIKILVNDEDMMYGIAGYSANYASSVFINGKWVFDEGKTGDSFDTEESSEAYRVLSVAPENGVIEIVVQTSSFANIDTSTAMGWAISEYENLRVYAARKTTADVVIMSWYAFLALISMLLFLVLPTYKANGWLVLLALTWAVRTGLKNTKYLLTLFPIHNWAFVFKLEIMTSFFTIALLALIIDSVFPKSLPKWLRRSVLGANLLAIGYIAVMPWHVFRGHSVVTNPIVYFLLAIMCAAVLISLKRRQEKPSISQLIFLVGTALVLLSFVWDQGYFKYQLFPWAATQPMMLVFIVLMLLAAMLATMNKISEREVELVHKINMQEKEIIKHELELTDNRTAIMLSQIQPHFLFNSLLAIQDLCSQDAKLAEKTVSEFSTYLRGNLMSLNAKEPISFEKELQHVKTYLSLEKIRFEERLQVIYDIEVKDFFIPALTLQPIVENAVNHGVTKRLTGGQVIISTREDETHWLIIVEDSGVGFDTEQSFNDEKHIGIQNVRHRLKTMCEGTLEIESTPEVGTVATIAIPKS